MLDFSFSSEQEAFRRTLRNFALKQLLPNYTKWERQKEFPSALWRKMGELGVTGIRVKSEYDGSDADFVTAGLAAEEIARGDFNAGYAVMLNGLIGEILQRHGSEQIKQSWLKPMAAGKIQLAIAITEPSTGSDAAAIETKVTREGNEYVLSGEKSGISLAKTAGGFLVFAKTDPEADAKGVSAFIVPRNSPGVDVSVYEDMGNIPIGRGSVFLDQVRIPLDHLVGLENQGFRQVMNGFDFSRALIALQCIGAAEQTLDETIAHVKERQSFGRPLATYQGVSFPIVEYHTQLEMAKGLCYRTLWLRDQGLPHTKEASMCKWVGPDIAQKTIHQCLLLNGHYAYTKELPIEQRLRDVIGLEIGDGTAQMQKIVIVRELLGKEFKPTH